jgi:hypothetical protein
MYVMVTELRVETKDYHHDDFVYDRDDVTKLCVFKIEVWDSEIIISGTAEDGSSELKDVIAFKPERGDFCMEINKAEAIRMAKAILFAFENQEE